MFTSRIYYVPLLWIKQDFNSLGTNPLFHARRVSGHKLKTIIKDRIKSRTWLSMKTKGD